MTATAEEVAWCEGIWGAVKDGGSWAIPRSGLMFRKDEGRPALVLYARIPHHPEMPCTPEQLRQQQDDEVVAVRERFEQLGIEVLDET